ncbi:MAG TPA: acetylglutamate kinase [Candidatus Merdiplasma excrementigallinarum]|uniref:Acetylglutamate kinase n=1 Tax=Candidatus Merdiplasma excrementigallinarum TaxID=2840864 RepID=A0A9D1NY39_9FIRM|nr:acetylglutamate kinase [Candidatus Merdiplasma excrementigallinarum]
MEKAEMTKWLEKANVLIEALPYIQRFHGKTIVVKYGGSAMVDHALKKSVIRDVALLKLVGFRPIIVHGGGKEITRWVDRIGLETRFVNGLRVTDKETMEVAEMVLNRVNKGLVSMMEKVGLKAVGLSGKDGTVLRVQRKFSDGQDIGYVGEVTEVNPQLLNSLLDQDFIPVICPIGSDDEYHSYNINADDAACAIATAMKASKLVFLTDIEGVYRDPADPGSLISEMTAGEALELLKSGNVGGGMLPKIQNCVDAIQAGVSRVHILDGRIEHSLLLEFYTNRGIGTAIIGDEEERYHVEQ